MLFTKTRNIIGYDDRHVEFILMSDQKTYTVFFVIGGLAATIGLS